MLIAFTVGNFRSFRDPVTLDFRAVSRLAEDQEKRGSIFELSQNLSIVKSTAIYGANASGKSNLLRALRAMRKLVVMSSGFTIDQEIDVEPFLLNKDRANEPTLFEVEFMIDEIIYRYGFTVDKERIESEWLYRTVSRPAMVFERNGSDFNISKTFRNYKGVPEKTRDNVLFVSSLAQWNNDEGVKIVNWFKNVRFLSGLHDEGIRDFTIGLSKRPEIENLISNMVRKFDVGFDKFSIEEASFKERFGEEIPEPLKELMEQIDEKKKYIFTEHKVYDNDGKHVDNVKFDFLTNESSGTQKLFFVLGPIITTIASNGILIVDELDAKLHPLITRAIVEMFNSEVNKKCAQLIFATHDTHLLRSASLRRDQIWFVEKDQRESSDLYSLNDYKVGGKKVRSDANLERDYIQGKYGAIPFIGSNLFLEMKFGGDENVSKA